MLATAKAFLARQNMKPQFTTDHKTHENKNIAAMSAKQKFITKAKEADNPKPY